MKFIAKIDYRGIPYVGEFGIDEDWLNEDYFDSDTIVRNEDYGLDVTPNDILRAVAEHEIEWTSQMYFSNEKVKNAFNGVVE